MADVFELKHPVTTLQFRGAFHKKTSENIYLFDQMVAKKGVRYHAEFLGRWSGFRITVPENAAGIVNALLSNLDR
ncbi:MAG: hypothetical protein HY000_41970 [Planctomycetes bacterium]|nr:hypothetical protein [Planctomycetota bacterium]